MQPKQIKWYTKIPALDDALTISILGVHMIEVYAMKLLICAAEHVQTTDLNQTNKVENNTGYGGGDGTQ